MLSASLFFSLVCVMGENVLLAEPSPTPTPVAELGPLNLEDCFRLAAVRNDTLKLSQADIDAANARYAQAISSLFPSIHYQSQQNFFNAQGSSFQGGRTIGGGRDYSSQNALTVTAPIFDGFRNYNTIAAQDAAQQSSRFSLQRNYQLLYQDVSNAFYQIVTNENDLLILADQAKALTERVEELERRVKLGRSRPAEALQARSDLANARVTIEQITGLRNAARESLAFFIGLDPAKVVLKDSIELPKTPELESYLLTTNTRPDILAAIQDQRSARRQLSVAKGELLPDVKASGTYYLSQDPSSQRNYAFTFTIDLPLFDGGLIYNKIREKKALTHTSEIKITELRKTADRDVRTTFSDFNATIAQVAQLREAVSIARENYEAQEQDYKRGVVSNLDLLTALSQLHNTRRSLQEAETNARINLVKLHVAAGNLK
jgi:outer membrane protein